MTLLERYAPEWQLATSHETQVAAAPARVFAAVKRLDFSRSPIVPGLFRLRGLPERALTLEGLLASGFTLLGEHPERELTLGLVGRFWMPSGDLRRVGAEEFAAYSAPGTAKAVWAFLVEPEGEDRATLRTVTRITCSDRRSELLMRCYWPVVGPFSGLVRREALRLVRRDAEAPREPPVIATRG